MHAPSTRRPRLAGPFPRRRRRLKCGGTPGFKSYMKCARIMDPLGDLVATMVVSKLRMCTKDA